MSIMPGTPASRNSSASSAVATPKKPAPAASRAFATGTAPCRYASSLMTAITVVWPPTCRWIWWKLCAIAPRSISTQARSRLPIPHMLPETGNRLRPIAVASTVLPRPLERTLPPASWPIVSPTPPRHNTPTQRVSGLWLCHPLIVVREGRPTANGTCPRSWPQLDMPGQLRPLPREGSKGRGKRQSATANGYGMGRGRHGTCWR